MGCKPTSQRSLTDVGLAISLTAPVAVHIVMASQRVWYLAMHMLSVLGVCMQAESRRAQQLTKLAKELSHKLAPADA